MKYRIKKIVPWFYLGNFLENQKHT